MKLFIAGLLGGFVLLLSLLLANHKPLGFSGNVASLATPTTTQSTGSATGSLFVGSLIPNNDAQYDLGVASQRWRNLVLSGSITSVASSSVGGAFTVSGALQASSTLQASGLETLYSGFLSVASSSIASSLNVVGNLNASSSLFVGALIPNNYLTISSGNQTYSSTSLQVTNQFTELVNTSNTFKFVGNGVGYNTTTIMVTSTAADPTLHGGAEFIMKDALGYCKRAYIMGTSWVIEPCVSGAGTQYTAQAQVGPSTTIFNSTF